MTAFDVAIVGLGPRGLSVLERLLARLAERPAGAPVRIWTFEPGEPGAGRIWRTDQPELFLMNTVAGEVTMYSGGPDGGPPRAGAGPSLHQWLAAQPGYAGLGEGDYAPRAAYGRYLRAVFASVVAARPAGVAVHPVPAAVDRVYRHGARYRVRAGGVEIAADKVVLATGHPDTAPDARDRHLLGYARAHPGVRYLPGGPAADLDLTGIPAGAPAGVIGLGLTFFDLVAGLTVGRGGRFEAAGGGPGSDAAGALLRYRPSGREPRIVAGSRGGLPLLARGVNQKGPEYRYRPRLLTPGALAAARRRAVRDTGSPRLDFRRDLLPLVSAEVAHVYHTELVRQRHGDGAAAAFARRHLADPGRLAALRTEYRLDDAAPPDLARLARPFAGTRFAGPAAFQARVLELLRADVADALGGNRYGPVKAALDTLRDLRGVLRTAVEFGGLRPDSHRTDLLGWYAPVSALLSTGPGWRRLAELGALVEAGVVALVGPGIRVRTDPAGAGYVLDSPQVAGSARGVRTLVDARMPAPDPHRDRSPLTRQLLADGLISAYPAGGAAVTPAPFHPVGAGGRVDPDLYLIGVPTEGTRWFTQIGNGRPGPMTGFHADADAVAADLLAEPPVPAADLVGAAAPGGSR